MLDNFPNKNQIFPVNNKYFTTTCFLKNYITNPNIIIGDFTYYHDFESISNFEKNIKYHYDFIGDKLIIGKFCQIASGIQFIMNGANHEMHGISTYPFGFFAETKWFEDAPINLTTSYALKGDTILKNDIWIGTNVTIMPGVKIGNGAIIGANSVVTKNVNDYEIVGGNPAKLIRKRFSDDEIKKLLEVSWWDWSIEDISKNVKILAHGKVNEIYEIFLKKTQDNQIKDINPST